TGFKGRLITCRQAGPDCDLIAAGILSSAGNHIEAKNQKWVVASELFGQALGLSRFRRYRAINALEAACLARTLPVI
ncbi:MAG: hypothetical protein ACM3ZV_03805, partial [Bacillota bacterium]